MDSRRRISRTLIFPRMGVVMDDQPERDDATAGDAGARGRKAGRPGGAKQALNLRMDVGTIQRLKLHALARGTTASDLVTQLVEAHLRDVAMNTRGTECSD